jgi:hypothetical protein
MPRRARRICSLQVGQDPVQYVSNIYKYYIAYKLVWDHGKSKQESVASAQAKAGQRAQPKSACIGWPHLLRFRHRLELRVELLVNRIHAAAHSGRMATLREHHAMDNCENDSLGFLGCQV